MGRRAQPKQFSAYLVTWSDEPSMAVGAVLIDKGSLLERDWTVINWETDVTTAAVGRRLSRLCPECRIAHMMVGVLGHDGECGSDDVRSEAQQVLADAKKRVDADA